jgi:carbon-monoxide dehydrogenase small subunit
MKELTFILNGKEIILTADPFKRLLDVLREDLKLTGVKEGCGEGECGACAVLLDGILVNSCLVPVGLVAGREVMTPEGLAETEKGKQIVEALANAGAVQCGSCSPGMAMAAARLAGGVSVCGSIWFVSFVRSGVLGLGKSLQGEAALQH